MLLQVEIGTVALASLARAIEIDGEIEEAQIPQTEAVDPLVTGDTMEIEALAGIVEEEVVVVVLKGTMIVEAEEEEEEEGMRGTMTEIGVMVALVESGIVIVAEVVEVLDPRKVQVVVVMTGGLTAAPRDSTGEEEDRTEDTIEVVRTGALREVVLSAVVLIAEDLIEEDTAKAEEDMITKMKEEVN